MKTLSWLATGLALSGLLVGVANAAPAAPQARWTIMVYMSGDNNLEDYIVKDIEQETIDVALTTNWDEFLNAYAQ